MGALAAIRPATRHATPRVLVAAILLTACGTRHTSERGSLPGAARDSFDLWIAGGMVVDGTGAPTRRLDVLVRDGRIAYVGQVGPDTILAAERFDAAGLIVAPGFIDAHAHGDPTGDPAFENFLAMGVTTIVLGQDGFSPDAEDMAAHLDAVDVARPGVNVAYLVGHNTIRVEAGVGHGDPGADGLLRMEELVAEGLAAGAFGLSTGLEYDPGSRATADELAAVARPVAAAGAVVTSHLRSEDADGVEPSLDELLAQGGRSGARVHVSHLKIVLEDEPENARRLLRRMAEARAGGVAVTADLYPYRASYTGIGILFPEWARPPAEYATVLRTRRSELAEYLRRRVEARNGPGATLFGSGPWAGRILEDVAGEEGVPFEEILIELGPDGASAAYFVMDERVVSTLLSDPHVVISSDGSPTMLHPRGYGSFARVIQRYVVEEAVIPLPEAVRRMSGATAAVYRLDDADVSDPPRGTVRAGWAADLVAFDPTEVGAPADYEHPHRLAKGMRAVWVNGERVEPRRGHGPPGTGAGRALRATW